MIFQFVLYTNGEETGRASYGPETAEWVIKAFKESGWRFTLSPLTRMHVGRHISPETLAPGSADCIFVRGCAAGLRPEGGTK